MSNYCNFFVEISTVVYYEALNASNVWHLTINEHLKYHKTKNLKSLKINSKRSKNVNFAQYKCL